MKKVLGIILIVMGIVVTGLEIILKVKGHMSVSVIGSSDGPTSVFIAGKVGNTSAVTEMIVGIVSLAIGIFMIAKKK